MGSWEPDGMSKPVCSATGDGLMKFTTEHDMARIGRFAREQFGKRKVIDYHSDTTMYTNFYWKEDVQGRYRESVMSVSVKNHGLRRAHL